MEDETKTLSIEKTDLQNEIDVSITLKFPLHNVIYSNLLYTYFCTKC